MKTLKAVLCLLVWSATAALGASYDDLNDAIDAYTAGQWDAAIPDFDKALAANDLVPSLQYIAHLDRAIAHIAKRSQADMDLAYADLAACLALRPGDKAALDTLRLAHLGLGKLDEARHDMDMAIASDPGDE